MEARKPDRALIAVIAVIAVLVVVALIVVFGRGEPELLDADTPEGVVQRYSAAVIEGDEETAQQYLTQEVLDDCQAVESQLPGGSVRVTLLSTDIRSEKADVGVLVAVTSDRGPIGGDGWESESEFKLENTDGTWRIDRTPWELTICIGR